MRTAVRVLARVAPGNKKTLRFRRVFGGVKFFDDAARAYFLPVLRLNFVVNFSTRPAVSTRRFSPV
jgi:hypothetical protein